MRNQQCVVDYKGFIYVLFIDSPGCPCSPPRCRMLVKPDEPRGIAYPDRRKDASHKATRSLRTLWAGSAFMGRSLFAFARCAFGAWNEHAAIYRVHRAGPRVI